MECVRRIAPGKLLARGSLVHPYISQLSPRYKDAVENGYLIKGTDGTSWRWDLWQPGMGIVDITTPSMYAKVEYEETRISAWLER